jgi:hypothetical protein
LLTGIAYIAKVKIQTSEKPFTMQMQRCISPRSCIGPGLSGAMISNLHAGMAFGSIMEQPMED